MYGEKKTRLVTIKCRRCRKWVAVRVDPDDRDRHLHHGDGDPQDVADREDENEGDDSERP
jgi:hypothetical protein